MDISKQFINIGGKTILEKSIDKIVSWAKAYNHKINIILSLGENINCNFKHENITICNGGKTRTQSIINAINIINSTTQPAENDWIISHDAVRPFVSIKDIQRLWLSCKNDKVGGILAEKVSSTVKLANLNNGNIEIEKTLNREELYLAQTPQMFRYKILKNALAKFNNEQVTDESSAVEMLGLQPKIVISKDNNTKITTIKDLQLFGENNIKNKIEK